MRTIKRDFTDNGTNDYVMRNGLGARGIDYVAKTHSSTTTVGFPLYDAHGNNVATLSRNGSGGFNVNDRRAYDAWGVIRQGNTTGDPKGRYCANLGHVQDDESGLVYMRARYYEPTNGRFVSEDSEGDGSNWFIYCNNDPTAYVDYSGKCLAALLWAFATSIFSVALNCWAPESAEMKCVKTLLQSASEAASFASIAFAALELDSKYAAAGVALSMFCSLFSAACFAIAAYQVNLLMIMTFHADGDIRAEAEEQAGRWIPPMDHLLTEGKYSPLQN